MLNFLAKSYHLENGQYVYIWMKSVFSPEKLLCLDQLAAACAGLEREKGTILKLGFKPPLDTFALTGIGCFRDYICPLLCLSQI